MHACGFQHQWILTSNGKSEGGKVKRQGRGYKALYSFHADTQRHDFHRPQARLVEVWHQALSEKR
jgi:hypothetical protein